MTDRKKQKVGGPRPTAHAHLRLNLPDGLKERLIEVMDASGESLNKICVDRLSADLLAQIKAYPSAQRDGWDIYTVQGVEIAIAQGDLS